MASQSNGVREAYDLRHDPVKDPANDPVNNPASNADGVILQVADLRINRLDRAVVRAGRRIDLTPREFAVLEYLMMNAGHSVTRTMIVDHVWNLSFDSLTNIVDVYINYVRRKIDTPNERKLIRTVRGVGYGVFDVTV